MELALHGYQHDFLAKMKQMYYPTQGNSDDLSCVLQAIIDKALGDDAVMSAIFDDFHCVHCGSVKPEAWINARKGKKELYKFNLSAEAMSLLNAPVLVEVKKVGEPPVGQVIPAGPKRADSSKAARCCVDWAIKATSAVADGNPITAIQ